ncbi:hypothetical protein JHN63_44430 [Streptomyces sp. MBT65]|uniref:hypothetical protein n=1 Tax=Streptomyces sp. MBT65 TaxID=1488395 RepID=UPI001909F9B9|nr:hypothetical protein [Streptomyces sp. MBT65]MBK3580707.1 hypothetical protein [Streptomyces sp. MBT65]
MTTPGSSNSDTSTPDWLKPAVLGERAGPAAQGAVPAPPPAKAPRPPRGPPPEDPEVAARRQAFAKLLDEFRRTAVLVPLGDGPGPDEERGLLTADFNGIRFILAFSDEQALARYARARGAYAREWTYQSILGARLLDVAVPAAGVPCGVALDCADGPDGMVFPPVRGIVPDEVALDGDDGTPRDVA